MRNICTYFVEHNVLKISKAPSRSFASSNALALNAPRSSATKSRSLLCHSYRNLPSAIKLQAIKRNRIISTGYNRLVEMRYIPDCVAVANPSCAEVIFIAVIFIAVSVFILRTTPPILTPTCLLHLILSYS